MLIRPPRRVPNALGIYTGEWDLETLKIKGYGHVRYSEQFNGFYKSGYFEDGKLNGKGKKNFFDIPSVKKPYCQLGEFKDDLQVNGLCIDANEVQYAEKNSDPDFPQRFD